MTALRKKLSPLSRLAKIFTETVIGPPQLDVNKKYQDYITQIKNRNPVFAVKQLAPEKRDLGHMVIAENLSYMAAWFEMLSNDFEKRFSEDYIHLIETLSPMFINLIINIELENDKVANQTLVNMINEISQSPGVWKHISERMRKDFAEGNSLENIISVCRKICRIPIDRSIMVQEI